MSPAPRRPHERDDVPPLRADARRNREKLVVAARSAFATVEGPASLGAIAREAGVGIGTLYRHFPTRESLVDAVYAAELDHLAGRVPELLREQPAPEALRTWLGRYAEFVATKRGMRETLRGDPAPGRLAPPSRERITATIAVFLEHGAAAGTLRPDVPAEDVTSLLVGVFLDVTIGAPAEQTNRLLDLVVAAVRRHPEAS